MIGLPSQSQLDYVRALLEVVALIVGVAWLAWYSGKVGPARAAEHLARSKV